MIVISDASPIANLILIDKLALLHEIFHTVIIPPIVDKEINLLKDFDIDLSNY